MAFDAGAIVATLELRKDQWDKSVRKVKDDQKSLRGLVLRNSQQFKQMGRTMIVAGGAVVGAVGLMVKAHATFDKAMTESLAIMGDISEATRKEMAQTALDMSGKSTFAAKELAEAYFFLASAGMDAEQSIKALPVVTKFAQAGAFDLAVATDLLTDAQTALGLSSKDAVENQKNLIAVSDVLVKANTLANASVLQFSESLTNRAAAALVNVNKSMEEGVAILAAFADKGVKGQKAGMRLAMMLNALDVAARKNAKAWEENGLTLFDAQGEMRNTADIIGDLEDRLGGMTTEQRAATLAALGFNIRTKASILTLMGSSEKIRQWEKDLKDAGGTTEEVSKKQLQTLINQFTILKNKITNAAISIGQTLGPALRDTIEKLKSTIGKVAEWIKIHPKLTEVIAKSAVAFGGLLMVLGPLMMMLPGLIAAGPLIGAAFTAMLGPIGLVIIGLTALVGWTNHVINISKKRSDVEMDAMVNTAKGHAAMWALRKKLIENEIVTVEEWGEIYEKHGRSHKRIMIAMANSPEYAFIREELDKLKKAKEDAGKSDDDLTTTILENSDKVIELTTNMVDEIMQATLGEYEYRIWAAKQTYEERKALLESEKADNQAFFLAKKALDAELGVIEKERTQKLQEEWNNRAIMLYDAINAGFEAEKTTMDKISELRAGYTDTVMELTLSEKDYKLWALDVWYAGELKKLGDNLDAKFALEQAYAAKKKKLDDSSAASKKLNLTDMAMVAGNVLTAMAGKSKALAIAGAVISTYAAVAQTLKTFGWPAAIPFMAAALAAGLKQVAMIKGQEIPSAAEGAFLTEPTAIVAGHGPMGELVSPIPMMKSVFKETILETGGGTKIELNFYAPIITATGLTDRDMDEAAEYILEKVEGEIRRLGGGSNA